VLDFGCGSGALSCLKKKGCELTGIDLSPKALEIAQKENGYDDVFCGDLSEYENLDYFDYVISLDVFGHIPFEDKDKVIERLKMFLKPDGVMLHGIECGQIDYDAMSNKELANFIKIDGHVGCEGKQENFRRFKKYFNFVGGEVRYGVNQSAEEYLKQIHQYGANINQTLQAYLETMNSEERQAFDISAGMTMMNMENHNYPSPDDASGCLFLRASDQSLEDKPLVFPQVSPPNLEGNLISQYSVFARGWYPLEKNGDTSFRWSQKRSFLSLKGIVGKELKLTVFSSYPMVNEKSIDVYFLLNGLGKILKKVTLHNHEPVRVNISLAEMNDDRLVEVFTDLTWIPKLLIESVDDRELGIGVADVYVE
jgi:trans-aconitate methyltransferase